MIETVKARTPAGSPPYLALALVRYMLALATWGRGPVALVGHMYRDLVEKCHWIPKSRMGAAVLGIIAMSAFKLTTKNAGKDKLLWAIILVQCAVTVITESETI